VAIERSPLRRGRRAAPASSPVARGSSCCISGASLSALDRGWAEGAGPGGAAEQRGKAKGAISCTRETFLCKDPWVASSSTNFPRFSMAHGVELASMERDGRDSGGSSCLDSPGPSAGPQVVLSAPNGPADAFGIGAMIGSKHAETTGWVGQPKAPAGALFVLKLEAGGPAKLSGQVREGDELLAVDRQKVADLTSQAVAELLHGPQGSLVKLRLRRKSITFDVCLQREAARQDPPVRKTRTLNPVRKVEGATEVLEKLYGSFARVNNTRTVPKPEKMSAEETQAFHAAQQEKAKRQESIAKRCLDATKRRRAEIGVLKVALRARNARVPRLGPACIVRASSAVRAR